MDARVDDFLNEIDGIIPTKQKEMLKTDSTSTCDWEECYDDTSGFSYYWNVHSNEVTWEIPPDYKKWKTQQKKPKPPKVSEKHPIYKPETHLSTAVPITQIPDTIIYKLGETLAKQNANKDKNDKLDIVTEATKEHLNRKISDKRKRHKPPDDSEDDEKITLISSYGGDTESEDEENENFVTNSKVTLTTTKELPSKNIGSSSAISSDNKKVTGITLLASYGDDSDDDEELSKQSIFGINKDKNDITAPKIAQSTLFPIQEAIDASQFETSSSNKPALLTRPTLTDEQKIYQRKRRIGLELPQKPSEVSSNLDVSARSGFGFKTSNNVKYTNFKSAGKMSFVKSDTAAALCAGGVANSLENADLLKEKLDFLREGKEADISPVQIWLIQLDTLQTARIAGCLQTTYLQKWLQQTNEEISKLEKDSTPDGWFLDWDRGQKRYSYRHLQSGHVQWEYPTASSGHARNQALEDMDICTTPPPPPTTTPPSTATLDCSIDPISNCDVFDVNQHDHAVQSTPVDCMTVVDIVAPPPPKIGRVLPPVAPPPPILTEDDMLVPPLPLMPEELPPPPPPPPPEEPLPPGVDIPAPSNIPQNAVQSEFFNTALDSFYSDIAAIESSSVANVCNTEEVAQIGETSAIINAADVIPVESVKKRKKMRISHGLSMKKKGVSKLVEKWKNVQKNLD